jgi:UDPglucose 6-dehydrogenase
VLPESISYADSIDAAVEGADAVVLMTEWNQYRGLDLAKLKSQMRGNVFVDLRNVYERGMMEKHGLAYACVGR